MVNGEMVNRESSVVSRQSLVVSR